MNVQADVVVDLVELWEGKKVYIQPFSILTIVFIHQEPKIYVFRSIHSNTAIAVFWQLTHRRSASCLYRDKIRRNFFSYFNHIKKLVYRFIHLTSKFRNGKSYVIKFSVRWMDDPEEKEENLVYRIFQLNANKNSSVMSIRRDRNAINRSYLILLKAESEFYIHVLNSIWVQFRIPGSMYPRSFGHRINKQLSTHFSSKVKISLARSFIFRNFTLDKKSLYTKFLNRKTFFQCEDVQTLSWYFSRDSGDSYERFSISYIKKTFSFHEKFLLHAFFSSLSSSFRFHIKILIPHITSSSPCTQHYCGCCWCWGAMTNDD